MDFRRLLVKPRRPCIPEYRALVPPKSHGGMPNGSNDRRGNPRRDCLHAWPRRLMTLRLFLLRPPPSLLGGRTFYLFCAQEPDFGGAICLRGKKHRLRGKQVSRTDIRRRSIRRQFAAPGGNIPGPRSKLPIRPAVCGRDDSARDHGFRDPDGATATIPPPHHAAHPS